MELPADKEIRILFSFVGMQEQERVVRDQKVLDVILKEEIAEMEEVIVTGYSTRKVSEMTGRYSNSGEGYRTVGDRRKSDECLERPYNRFTDYG